MKRSRGRNRRSGGNNNNHNNPNRHYESVGPDVKIRGSAQQVLEKYLQYARDAQTSGDRILSEAYYQFAEHYQRIVAKQNEAKERQQQQRQAERDARRENRDNRNESDNGNDNDSTDEDDAKKGVSEKETSQDDGMEVIDAKESGDTDDKGSKKPSRGRRKPYKAKSDDKSGAGEEAPDEGVLKTVSRGRRKKTDTVDADDSAAEAAES